MPRALVVKNGSKMWSRWVGRDACAGILHRHSDEIALQPRIAFPALGQDVIRGADSKRPAFRHGVARIHREIDQGDFQRIGIGIYRPCVGRNRQPYLDILPHRSGEQTFQFGGAILDAKANRLMRAALRESEQLPRQGLPALHRCQDRLGVGLLPLLVARAPLDALGAALHDHQQVIEVMRDAPGHPPERFQPPCAFHSELFLPPQLHLAQQQPKEYRSQRQSCRQPGADQPQGTLQRRHEDIARHADMHRPVPDCKHAIGGDCRHALQQESGINPFLSSAGTRESGCLAGRPANQCRRTGTPRGDVARSVDHRRDPMLRQVWEQEAVANGVRGQYC